MDAEDVRKVQFRKPPGVKPGYAVDEVDSFLDRVADRLLMKTQLTAAAVREIAFTRARPGQGYNMDEVDLFLDQAEAALSELEGGQSAGAFIAKTAAAGWYTDPGGSARSRYFDGTRWTNKYRSQPATQRKSWWRQPAFGRLSIRTAVIIAMVVCVVGIGTYEYFNPFGEPKLTYLHHVQDFTRVEPRCSNSTKPYSCFSEDLVKGWGAKTCRDLRAGATGAKEVALASREAVVGQKNAEIMVYWAITDLCPDQVSQRQDRWNNGS
jgi:DivIVA domain-containing protein